LFYSFTDDELAPRAAINQLLGRLSSARIDHRRVHPGEHGGTPIGHFGFFRPRFRETLWRDASAFLLDVVEGRVPAAATPPKPWNINAEDIRADLAYGRS
jgi:hypothetical protein